MQKPCTSMTKTITLTEEELFKFETITKLIGGTVTIKQVREQLDLSIRQIKRLKRNVVKFGAAGAAHGLRGKPSNNRTAQVALVKAPALLKEKYPDFGPTFAAEKLRGTHDVSLSKERVRQLMVELGLWKPKPRKENSQYRAWRPRKEWFGSMEQFDGSYHRWFEDRADECCLLASIDDATGRITRAKFGQSESVREVSSFWKGYVLMHGKPIAIYLDKFSTYKINHKNAVDNHELMTQFQQMMKTLDVRLVSAHSPEAKGRIERLFGTLQDRLVKELRLAGISTIPEANTFLETFIPKFNAQFGVAAAEEGDLHRPLTGNEKENLDAIFSVQSMRRVRNDFTIQFENQWIQLEKIQPCTVLRGEAILIERRLDDTLHIRLREHYLAFKALPVRPERTPVRVTALVPRIERKPWKPAKNHPWKKSFKRQLRQG
jgi:transposase